MPRCAIITDRHCGWPVGCASRTLGRDRKGVLALLATFPDPRARGSAAGEPARHLLAALDHDRGVVLGQVDVQAKTNEIPMFAPLLDRIDLAGAVVTADALHAQSAHAQYLAGLRRAYYLINVKRNQPGLHAQLAGLPWRQVLPHAAQAIQVIRRRRRLNAKDSRKWTSETVYAVTSLTAAQASPAQLAAIVRGHWSIEDNLHWVRDMTFGEDSPQVRTRNGPASWPACATWLSPSCG